MIEVDQSDHIEERAQRNGAEEGTVRRKTPGVNQKGEGGQEDKQN